MVRALVPTVLLLSLTACASRPPGPSSERDVLTARTYIEADYDDVWDRFTRAAAFADWYTSPCRQFGLEPGASLVWAVEDRVVYRGRLLYAEKGRGLAWEFQFVGFGFDEAMTPVEVEILDRGPTVLVSVRHDVTGAPGTAEMISPVGWAKPLSRLKTLLEAGHQMQWPVEPE
jgi:uncharacterized protein YndB with AHSA1/START domain